MEGSGRNEVVMLSVRRACTQMVMTSSWHISLIKGQRKIDRKLSNAVVLLIKASYLLESHFIS